ncbi:nitrate reductase [Streptomyces triticagri]|uniref:Nitrate reductase n=1 Tax=Streptomyces triticagri TaxID=2293568 RepID=A0A372M6K3_9ACTN|nr:cytosine permease [Streptomyces triticagri]RFU86083.1 nitrate reductase [Streptomyces triticagri]
MTATIPDPHPEGAGPASEPTRTTGAGPGAPPVPGPDDAPSATRVEVHGVDHIPDAERHGKARELFSVWAASQVNYLGLLVGGTLVLMGLSLWQAVAVTFVGSAFWLLTGLLATSGPASGTPSEVITRAMYGVRANRVNNAVVGWIISVCYFALNLAAAATAAFALVERVGIRATTAVQVVVVLVIAALTLVISVYGHGMIMKLYLPITLVLSAAFAVVAVVVVQHADFSYTPAEPLTGVELWGAILAGVTLMASGALSYTTSADFSRYLPRTTPPRAVLGWTALGAFLPGLIVSLIGTLAATTVDMSDPQTALEQILPGWFTPVFLLALVLGTIAINALTAYSAGLALQSVGLRIRRSVSVLFDGAAAVALTLYGLLASSLLDTISNVMQITVVLLGPAMAVYATDILLRRNRYDGPALTDESRGSLFWFTGGVNWAGVTALSAGTAAAALCVNSLYTGPLASALHGLDLALPVGMTVAAVAYAALGRRAIRATTPGT